MMNKTWNDAPMHDAAPRELQQRFNLHSAFEAIDQEINVVDLAGTKMSCDRSRRSSSFPRDTTWRKEQIFIY